MPNFTLKLPIGSAFLPRLHQVAEGVETQRAHAICMGLAAGDAGLCAIYAISLRGDTIVADGIAYLCSFIGLLACSSACVAFVRRERGMSRMRWGLFATACVSQALVFLAAALGNVGWLRNTIERPIGVSCSCISAAAIILAATVFVTRSSRAVVALDMAQALLFCSLRYFLTYAPDGVDLFRKNHLVVSTASYGFFFITAMLGLLGVRSESERKFLRLLATYLGLTTFTTFLENQVAFTWLHNPRASILDLPELMGVVGFAYILVRSYYRTQSETPLAPASAFWRNSMPSFLALANLAMALLVLQTETRTGVAAIVLATVFYFFRTGLQQGDAGEEQDRLHKANLLLQQLATLDPLTGAGNRRSLATAVMNLARMQDFDVFSLVLVDADWFKQANDHHGHLYGDQVLVAIANVLRSAAGAVADGHCARLGGDEFALLLPNCDSDAAFLFAEEVRLRIKALDLRAGDRTISISVGATVSNTSAGHTFESLMSRADEALYRAKSLGRNRVEILA